MKAYEKHEKIQLELWFLYFVKLSYLSIIQYSILTENLFNESKKALVKENYNSLAWHLLLMRQIKINRR